MLDLTFGEQVKIILSRKGMTIKELAEIIEEKTGKKMSRQNLTQRLGRDNFQEQDMRMIAEILECPFHLTILSDGTSERTPDTAGAELTGQELSRLAKAKARKEERAKKVEQESLATAMEQIPSEMEEETSEKEMTLGDYIDIHEELKRRETGKIPEVSVETQEEEDAAEEQRSPEPETVPVDIFARPEESEEQQTDVEEVLRELEKMEKESYQSRMREQPEQKTEKKPTGWRAVFQRRHKKVHQEEAVQTEPAVSSVPVQEPQTEPEPEPEYENDFIEYSQPEPEEVPEEIEEIAAETFRVEEAVEEEDEEAEDLTKGEMNPYTGHEYETNSVRMHPKRIGYVQVYDRRDHAWTDMTEWAFLGYQERKKALLGRDYEPPIYLD